MELNIVRGYSEFNTIKENMINLFGAVFNRQYPISLWEHFYRDVPSGNPIGVGIWDQKKLVGFSSILPQEIMDPVESRAVPYGLLVSLMIHPEYRAGGKNFFNLIESIKEVASKSEYSFLLCLPNQNSYLPFIRFSKFKLIDEARMVYGEITDNYRRFLMEETKKAFFTERFWQWRLTRFCYDIKSGYVMKNHEGQYQILDMLTDEQEQTITGFFPWWNSAGSCPYDPVNDYTARICYFSIDGDFDVAGKIKKSVLLSDAF